MEAEVSVRCRKSDENLVLSVIESAIDEYKEIIQREVKRFQGKDVPCKVTIDKNKYLPEYNEKEGGESCMGGLVIHCRRGRIVCSNTLDERLQLCYQEAIPDVRRILFPSFQTENKMKAKAQEVHKIKHA